MTDWEKIRQKLAMSPIKAAAPTFKAADRQRAMDVEILAVMRGAPVCALCTHALGHGPDCYRCARFA